MNAASLPASSWPLVRTHPETGRRSLYVNAPFTMHVEGMEPEESERVLKVLYRQASVPQFQCRFRWRDNSIAFWDNRCVQHHAMWDYFPHGRLGYRVTVAGDKPY